MIETAECAIHNVNEYPADGQVFFECFECLHVFVTEGDLIEMYNTLGVGIVSSVDAIFFCPLCLHDV